jgi:hypothetical protein
MTFANLENFERACQDIMLQVSQARGEELSELVHQFAGSGNIYILRGLSSRLAQADAGEGIHRLAFPLIEGLSATQDPNVLTNLMTALARLEQSGVDWKTDEHLATARRLSRLCRSVAEMLGEDADDFERQYLD